MQTQWKSYTKPFRDTWIRSIKSDTNLQISDGTIAGLHLRYSALTGKVSFYLACKIRNSTKRRNIFLGKYGETPLPEIKDMALDYRKQISRGQDPMYEQEEERRIQEKEQAKRIKVDTLFPQYMQKYAKLHKKPSTYKSNEDQYRLYMGPKLGHMFITDIEERHIIDAYSDWARATSFSTANKALSLVSSFWDWCASYNYVPKGYNPCHYVKKGKNEKIQINILDKDSYKEFFKALDLGSAESDYHPRFFHALRVIALTGCRSQEIRTSLINEFEPGAKILHLHDSKTGARDVKLSDAAAAEIEKAIIVARKLGSKYIFPGIRNPKEPICDLRKALIWALNKAKLGHMRIHDLRHSFNKYGGEYG